MFSLTMTSLYFLLEFCFCWILGRWQIRQSESSEHYDLSRQNPGAKYHLSYIFSKGQVNSIQE
jgi:hypothetical protein